MYQNRLSVSEGCFLRSFSWTIVACFASAVSFSRLLLEWFLPFFLRRINQTSSSSFRMILRRGMLVLMGRNWFRLQILIVCVPKALDTYLRIREQVFVRPHAVLFLRACIRDTALFVEIEKFNQQKQYADAAHMNSSGGQQKMQSAKKSSAAPKVGDKRLLSETNNPQWS